jgi:hypothetical protein
MTSSQVPESFDPTAILPQKILVDYARVRNAPVGSSTVRGDAVAVALNVTLMWERVGAFGWVHSWSCGLCRDHYSRHCRCRLHAATTAAAVTTAQALRFTFNASSDARLFNAAGEPVSAVGEWTVALQYDGVDGVFEANLSVTKAR